MRGAPQRNPPVPGRVDGNTNYAVPGDANTARISSIIVVRPLRRAPLARRNYNGLRG
jgi:hypothetical protein